ncbi:hypothetical protein IF650_19035 [Cellulosimicrobium terreum]|nr:hypothetical protein [Cellulosimicrobium terreum]
MSSFPGSPRVLPGAIVAVDPLSPLARVVIFQYNPQEVTRQLRPRTPPAGGGASVDAQRIWGAPTESISMTLELDATDGMESSDPVATTTGVLPQLSALEMLLYPSAATVAINTGLLAAGTIEVLPPQGPLTVLVWGPGRVVPVTVSSVTVREQAFNPALAPVRASVDVTLDALTYDDLAPTNPGFALYVAHHVAAEVLASVAAVSGVVGASVELSVGS